jgi:hypothetical protein
VRPYHSTVIPPNMGPAEATLSLRKPCKVTIDDGRYSPESDRLLRCRDMTRWAISDKVHRSIYPTGEPRLLKQLCRVKCVIENKISFDAAMTLH